MSLSSDTSKSTATTDEVIPDSTAVNFEVLAPHAYTCTALLAAKGHD
jgi:hypothetical protein